MKDLALYIVTRLVDHPEAVEVTETQSETGSVILTLKVDPADMGRVIGKEGKVINAIRDTVKILALKLDKHVDVILAE